MNHHKHHRINTEEYQRELQELFAQKPMLMKSLRALTAEHEELQKQLNSAKNMTKSNAGDSNERPTNEQRRNEKVGARPRLRKTDRRSGANLASEGARPRPSNTARGGSSNERVSTAQRPWSSKDVMGKSETLAREFQKLLKAVLKHGVWVPDHVDAAHKKQHPEKKRYVGHYGKNGEPTWTYDSTLSNTYDNNLKMLLNNQQITKDGKVYLPNKLNTLTKENIDLLSDYVNNSLIKDPDRHVIAANTDPSKPKDHMEIRVRHLINALTGSEGYEIKNSPTGGFEIYAPRHSQSVKTKDIATRWTFHPTKKRFKSERIYPISDEGGKTDDNPTAQSQYGRDGNRRLGKTDRGSGANEFGQSKPSYHDVDKSLSMGEKTEEDVLNNYGLKKSVTRGTGSALPAGGGLRDGNERAAQSASLEKSVSEIAGSDRNKMGRSIFDKTQEQLKKAEDEAGMTAYPLKDGYSLHHETSSNGYDIWSIGHNGQRAGSFMICTDETRRGRPFVSWAGVDKPHRGKGIGAAVYKTLSVHYGGLDSDRNSTSVDAIKAWRRAGGRQLKIKTQFGDYRYTLDGDKKRPPIVWNEDFKKSSDPLAPLIQQAKANLAAVHKVASQEPRPMLFGGKNGSGRHGFVSLDPSKPNQWRVTHFVKGKPSGHTEAASFSDAIKKAHSYGYNVSKELSEEDMSKTEGLEKNTNKIPPSFAHIKNIDNFDDFTQSVKKLPETTKKEIINYQEEYNKNPPLSSNEELYYHGTPFFNEIKEGGFKNTEGGRAGFLGFVHKVQNLGNYFSDDKRLAHYYGSDRASHHTNNSNNYEVLSVKVNKGNCLDLTEPKVKIPTAIKKLGLKRLQQYDGLLRSHFIRGKDMVVLLDDPDFVKSLTNHGYDSVKFKEDKGILKNANSSGHTLFVMNPNKLKVHKPIRTLRDMFNHFKELSEEDMSKTEDLEKGTQSNKNKFTNAIKEIAKKHNLHDPNYSYWECDNFSRAAHKVAKEMGIKSEVWRSELEYDHDIKEIKAGEKHGHTFLKIDNEFHDYTASQATSKIPAVYVGNAPHPRHEGAIKNDDQDYYDKYGSDFWYDKIKEKLSEQDMKKNKMKKSEDFSRVSSVVVATDDKMLMLQRRDNGKWTFPGGHLNDTESHLEGAVRELWEEAGIRANPDEMILLGSKKTFQNKDIHVYLYMVNSEVKPSAANDPDKEAQKFAWLPHVLPEEIKENLYIPVGDNSSLSMFSVWLLRQKTNKLKELVESKKSV